MKRGFTLIELLVVVLIIGILAAMALPQYQVAVAKSRLGAVIPNVRALKNAEEVYYMANGTYLNDTFDELPMDLSGFRQVGLGHYTDGKTGYDMLTAIGGRTDVIGYVRDNNGILNSYGMHLDFSNNPGKTYCCARTNSETANKVCKSLGGTSYAATQFTATYSTACNLYELP